MRRSNLLTLRKYFNWHSNWCNKYSYSDLVLRDTIFNFYFINLFKLLKLPTSMLKIKHISLNIILLEFDLYVCWIVRLLKYFRSITWYTAVIAQSFRCSVNYEISYNYDIFVVNSFFENLYFFNILTKLKSWSNSNVLIDNIKETTFIKLNKKYNFFLSYNNYNNFFNRYNYKISNKILERAEFLKQFKKNVFRRVLNFDKKNIKLYEHKYKDSYKEIDYIFFNVFANKSNIYLFINNIYKDSFNYSNYLYSFINISCFYNYFVNINSSFFYLINYIIKLIYYFSFNNNYNTFFKIYHMIYFLDHDIHNSLQKTILYLITKTISKSYINVQDSKYRSSFKSKYKSNEYYEHLFSLDNSIPKTLKTRFKLFEIKSFVKKKKKSKIDKLEYFDYKSYYYFYNSKYSLFKKLYIYFCFDLNFPFFRAFKFFFFHKSLASFDSNLIRSFWFFQTYIQDLSSVIYSMLEIDEEGIYYDDDFIDYISDFRSINSVLSKIKLTSDAKECTRIWDPYLYFHCIITQLSRLKFFHYLKRRIQFLKIGWYYIQLNKSKSFFVFEVLYWFLKYIWNKFFNVIYLFCIWRTLKLKMYSNTVILIDELNNYVNYYKKLHFFTSITKKEFKYFFYNKHFFFKSIIEFKYLYRILVTPKKLRITNRYIKYYFFIEFFDELIFSIEKTFYFYLNNSINVIVLPNIFFFLKPSIMSAKLLCDYVYFKLKRKLKPRKVYTAVRRWQIRERSLFFFKFTKWHYMYRLRKFRKPSSIELSHHNLIYSFNATFRLPLKGVRIILSGPPYKARRKVKQSYHLWVANHDLTGNMPLQSFEYIIDYYQTFVVLKRATLGLKVWLLLESYLKYK